MVIVGYPSSLKGQAGIYGENKEQKDKTGWDKCKKGAKLTRNEVCLHGM